MIYLHPSRSLPALSSKKNDIKEITSDTLDEVLERHAKRPLFRLSIETSNGTELSQEITRTVLSIRLFDAEGVDVTTQHTQSATPRWEEYRAGSWERVAEGWNYPALNSIVGAARYRARIALKELIPALEKHNNHAILIDELFIAREITVRSRLHDTIQISEINQRVLDTLQRLNSVTIELDKKATKEAVAVQSDRLKEIAERHSTIVEDSSCHTLVDPSSLQVGTQRTIYFTDHTAYYPGTVPHCAQTGFIQSDFRKIVSSTLADIPWNARHRIPPPIDLKKCGATPYHFEVVEVAGEKRWLWKNYEELKLLGSLPQQLQSFVTYEDANRRYAEKHEIGGSGAGKIQPTSQTSAVYNIIQMPADKAILHTTPYQQSSGQQFWPSRARLPQPREGDHLTIWAQLGQDPALTILPPTGGRIIWKDWTTTSLTLRSGESITLMSPWDTAWIVVSHYSPYTS